MKCKKCRTEYLAEKCPKCGYYEAIDFGFNPTINETSKANLNNNTTKTTINTVSSKNTDLNNANSSTYSQRMRKNEKINARVFIFFRILLTASIVCGIIGTVIDTSTQTNNNSIDVPEIPDIPNFGNNYDYEEELEEGHYDEGIYEVGVDIDPGLYKLSLRRKNSYVSLGTVTRYSTYNKYNVDDSKIIATSLISGDQGGYLEILPTDKAVKLSGVSAKYIENVNDIVFENKTVYEEGSYLVNHDIMPGKYRLESEYTTTIYRYTDATLEVTNGTKLNLYDDGDIIEIYETDYLIKYLFGTLTKID